MSITGNASRSRLQQGFSLIELLVALAMGLAVLVGLSSVYVAVKQSFRFAETSGRLLEDGTFALDMIARDLRMAGYAGCPGITNFFPGSVMASTDGPEVTRQPFTPNNFIRGFFDEVPEDMVEPEKNPTPVVNADSLFFAGGSSKAVAVSARMDTTTSTLTLAGDPYGWAVPAGSAANVYDMIVSSCSSSSIFKGKVTVNDSGVVSIDHSRARGNTQDTFEPAPLFGTDAIVMPAEWSFYYVATLEGARTPSLFRVFYNGNTRSKPEVIISNIESLKLQYGENTNDARPFVVNEWRTCSVVPAGPAGPAPTSCPVLNWSRVVAVRIGLMLVSSEDNANPGVTLPSPTLLGKRYEPPIGTSANRLRKEFSTTVVLRNRVASR